jgi:hypothetical protein
MNAMSKQYQTLRREREIKRKKKEKNEKEEKIESPVKVGVCNFDHCSFGVTRLKAKNIR